MTRIPDLNNVDRQPLFYIPHLNAQNVSKHPSYLGPKGGKGWEKNNDKTRIAAAILELAAALFPVPDLRCTIWCWL